MRQLCNVAYVVQAEGKVSQPEMERWLLELRAPPEGVRSARRRSHVTKQVLDLMPVAVVAGPKG